MELNSISTTTSTINTGVLQGSILGPVWFLMYINYMPNAGNAFNFILYTDDSMLLSAIQNTLACYSKHPDNAANVNSMLDKLRNQPH